jgi:hypothetical protein
MPEASLTEPQLLPDEQLRENHLLARLDGAIRTRPDRLWLAVVSMGDMALQADRPIGPPTEEDARLLDAVFEEGLDQWVDFDPATETALAEDRQHTSLIQRMQAQQARTMGKHQKVRIEDNPGALRYRDIIRRRRLGVLLLRRMEWQNNLEREESDLPVAS